MASENNRENNSRANVGRDSVMKPLDPDKARQPLSDDTLNEMQSTGEPNRSEDAAVEPPIENIDEITQESSGTGDRSIADDQMITVNRSAS